MKVRASVKKLCRNCKIIRREARNRVTNSAKAECDPLEARQLVRCRVDYLLLQRYYLAPYFLASGA
eukprot:gene1233-1422_t